MDIRMQGKLVDYLYSRLQPEYPMIIPDDLRCIIYKTVKKSMDKIGNDTMERIDEEDNGLIANVKPRHNKVTDETPIVTALGIGRRILKEKYIQ